LLASSPANPDAWLAVLALVAGAVVAQNALNTFDNADGAATSLAALALSWPAPLFAAPLVAFLPFNFARPSARRALPKSILGDSGSHVLGMLILLTPAAWPALALPLLDLARLCVQRARLSHRPWVGDRRHLAHRLEFRGLGARQVALALLCAASPSIVLGWCGARGALVGGVALGVLATAALFAVLTRWAPALPEPPAADEELGALHSSAHTRT
jgi:UDP-N-acetylmuramyl pentapeptide phosphotransferase/UDP-N-acetylglucosamine-1-phosphate transferase